MNHAVDAEVSALRAQATALAGRPGDLVQRAGVYHHLYRHSGGSHVFPLLAALHVLAEAFRDINRRVCIETWLIYQPTSRDHLAAAAQLVPPELHALMRRCHTAHHGGNTLSSEERRDLFTAFFPLGTARDHRAGAGPGLCRIRLAAGAPSDAQAMHRLQLPSTPLPFRDFADAQKRTAKGLAAFGGGKSVGWGRVEQSLSDYGIMPAAFARDPVAYLRDVLRGGVDPFVTPAMLEA